MAKIVVTLRPDGTSEVRVVGTAGPSCEEASRAYQKALGKTIEDRKTTEYYAPPQISKSRTTQTG